MPTYGVSPGSPGAAGSAMGICPASSRETDAPPQEGEVALARPVIDGVEVLVTFFMELLVIQVLVVGQLR